MEDAIVPRANYIVYAIVPSAEASFFYKLPLKALRVCAFQDVTFIQALNTLLSELSLGVWLDSKVPKELFESMLGDFQLIVLDPHFNSEFEHVFSTARRVGVLIRRQEIRS